MVGSLGYWLAQQEVQRGSQPTYYYLLLGGLYEFLPMLLSGVGIATVLYWLWRDAKWDPIPAADRVSPKPHGDGTQHFYGEGVLRVNRVYFAIFSIWWILGSWGAYTYAGEKMPWLMTHMALPMCVFGGWWLGRLIHRIDWSRARRSHAVWLIGVAPALIFTVVILLRHRPDLAEHWLPFLESCSGLSRWACSPRWFTCCCVGPRRSAGKRRAGCWHWVSWGCSSSLRSVFPICSTTSTTTWSPSIWSMPTARDHQARAQRDRPDQRAHGWRAQHRRRL
ncbi:MAG: hypothetical protein HC802_19045 [Caldilineaceae bacterium]|nr:hypothetical protein [Caldilineaceae bacterium]